MHSSERFGSLPVARHHVERHLDVEHILRQVLKGEQVDRLLVQFVHSLLAVLGCRLKHGGDHALDLGGLFGAQSEQRENRGRGMGDDHRARLQLRGHRLARLALDPGRSDRSSGFVFEREREIDDGVAKVARGFPVVARRARVGSEEGEVHALELLRANALDKVHLVADRFQSAERFVIVEQADIDGGKIAFAQNFGDFFSLERGRADDRHAVKVRAAQVSVRSADFEERSWRGES